MSATPDIFLSYNREDAEVARRFAEGFEAEGFEVWWDQALRSGEAYDEVTEAALRGAKAVVVLWSPRSVVSRWVRAEASIADENGTLVPVMIEACSLPVMFRLTQTPDLTHWKGATDAKAWLTFLGDVQRMVGKEPTENKAKPGAPRSSTGSGIPIVALLPILARGSGDELEFLAEDLTEEIAQELAKPRFCQVVAAGKLAAWRGKPVDYAQLGRETGARYLIEGKLQQAGENVRLSVQMVETRSASTQWSQRFVRELDEAAGSPEALAVGVAAELGEQIVQSEVARAMADSGSHSGWDHFFRAMAYIGQAGTENIERAIEELRRAITVLPDLGLAHAMLAAMLGGRVMYSGKYLVDDARRELQTHIKLAMALDGSNPMVITFVAAGHNGLGQSETTRRLARRAIELIPNSPRPYVALGVANVILGHIDEAIEAFEEQDRLTTVDTARSTGQTFLGVCYLLKGQAADAEAALDRALAFHPNFHVATKWKAIVAAHLGNQAAAKSAICQLREGEPDMSIDQHVRQINFTTGHSDSVAQHIETFCRLWAEAEDDG